MFIFVCFSTEFELKSFPALFVRFVLMMFVDNIQHSSQKPIYLDGNHFFKLLPCKTGRNFNLIEITNSATFHSVYGKYVKFENPLR